MKLPHLFAAIFCVAPLFAAPPAVTTLTPAGGQRGTTVTVSAVGSFDTWPVKVWCGTPGVTAAAEKEKGKFAVKLTADAPLGLTWLRFHDDTGASELRPFVVGGLAETTESEPNDDAKAAPTVNAPTVVNGVLAKSGDVDCFAVKLKKGRTLIASLDAHRRLRSPIDAVLQICSADRTILEANHDARGLDPELAYTALADETVVVRVFGFPSAPDSSIRHFGSPACVYRLTLSADEFIDFVTPLAVEELKESTLTPHGWNLKAKTITLGKSDTTVGVALPFPLARPPHHCVDLVGPTDKPLSPPFTATGYVRKERMPAVVPVSVGAGKPLTVRVESPTLGLSLTPVLKVTDADGKQVLKAEPATFGKDIEAAFAPAKAGTCNFEVSDLFGSAGPRHVFKLTVTPTAPDVTATVAADRFTLSVGKPLDIPITVAKKGGFTGEVVPFADGLPDGVTASVGTPVKGDGNSLVLKLTATRPASGPIRIGVKKMGDDKFQRDATATLPAFEVSTSDLWLTVTK